MKAQQANLELGDRLDELDLWSEGATMGTVTEREQRREADRVGEIVLHRAALVWEEATAGGADRLLTHMAGEHGIPTSIAMQIPAAALRRLCRDDQARDMEDWQR